jgi:hypothetical protein
MGVYQLLRRPKLKYKIISIEAIEMQKIIVMRGK